MSAMGKFSGDIWKSGKETNGNPRSKNYNNGNKT